MTRTAIVLLLALPVVAFTRPILAAHDGSLKGVDLFGTSQITIEEVQLRFGNDIKKMAEAILGGDDQTFADLYDRILSGIQAMGDFAYVGIAPVTYYGRGRYVYVTIDIVDQQDRGRRLGFSQAPLKEFSDPEGLLAAWQEYQDTAIALLDKGELKESKVRCPALHCVWGFDHPKLKTYLRLFQSRVPGEKKQLKAILREDKEESHRANAAFLLAHTSDPTELVKTLLPSIRDPASVVRNNVMRVLSDIATKRKDVLIPIDALIEALDFPETTDRNKSLVTLVALTTRPGNKEILIRKAGFRLIRLLRLLQPNNHDVAYAILKKISGKDFGELNYKAWEEWLTKKTTLH